MDEPLQIKINLRWDLPFDLFVYRTRYKSFPLELHHECAELERLLDEDFESFQNVHSHCNE